MLNAENVFFFYLLCTFNFALIESKQEKAYVSPSSTRGNKNLTGTNYYCCFCFLLFLSLFVTNVRVDSVVYVFMSVHVFSTFSGLHR